MQIETERLLLRQFKEADFEAYAQMLADPKTAQFIGGVRNQHEARAHYDQACLHWQKHRYGKFAVQKKIGGKLIGRVGPTLHDDAPEVELGWTIARPEWGRGYATEAARACAKWMFEALGVREVASFIDPDNIASIQVAAKLGQTHKRDITFEGEKLRVYAATRNEFIFV